jgi:hypothetical protein
VASDPSDGEKVIEIRWDKAGFKIVYFDQGDGSGRCAAGQEPILFEQPSV